jgi:hypothetical protein
MSRTLDAHAAPAPSPIRGWLWLSLAGLALLELLDQARATTELRRAWPLLIGSGPNAAAVFAVGGGAVGVALRARVNAGLLFAMSGLLAWEAAQPWTARGVFDWNDVMATVGTTALLVLAWPRVPWLNAKAAPHGDRASPRARRARGARTCAPSAHVPAP